MKFLMIEKFNKLFELPVKFSFNKFKTISPRSFSIFRKKVTFEIKGIEGSLDKEKLNSLHEAVVHLLRNSLDHGIEKPDLRLERGKDDVGQIEINCYKDEADFVISLKDDGGGIDEEVGRKGQK